MPTPDASSARSSLPMRCRRFLSTDLWRTQPENGPFRPLILLLRTILLAARGFKAHRGALCTAALSFYTLLSLVPLAAVIFGIAKGFGFELMLEKELLEQFSAQQEVVRQVIIFARNMLANVQGGVIAGIGVILLFWSVISVLNNIEGCFNQIWGTAGRSFLRKLSDYTAIIFIGPVLLILSCSLTVFIVTRVSSLSASAGLDEITNPLAALSLRAAPHVLHWILFAFLYLIMPNTRIRPFHAILAAMPAGTAYHLLQEGYIRFQISMTDYNAIYGSFAALPLFLLWLNTSWYIVLFGAEIVHALAHVRAPDPSRGKELSVTGTRLYALLLCAHASRRFHLALAAQRPDEIARELGLSPQLTGRAADLLTRAGILVRVHAGNNAPSPLQPAMDVRGLTLMRVLKALDDTGENPADMPQALTQAVTWLETLCTEMEHASVNRPLFELLEGKDA